MLRLSDHFRGLGTTTSTPWSALILTMIPTTRSICSLHFTRIMLLLLTSPAQCRQHSGTGMPPSATHTPHSPPHPVPHPGGACRYALTLTSHHPVPVPHLCPRRNWCPTTPVTASSHPNACPQARASPCCPTSTSTCLPPSPSLQYLHRHVVPLPTPCYSADPTPACVLMGIYVSLLVHTACFPAPSVCVHVLPVTPLQYVFTGTGTGTDVPLMEWLRKYTFAAEASYAADAEVCRLGPD